VSGELDRFAEQQMSKLADDAVGVVDRVLLRVVHTPAGDPGLTTRPTSPAAGRSVSRSPPEDVFPRAPSWTPSLPGLRPTPTDTDDHGWIKGRARRQMRTCGHSHNTHRGCIRGRAVSSPASAT
jgi:hypothetical protein